MDIQLDSVTFTYPGGVQALAGVSLRIASGESVAIIGANGAGKSTLARHLNGLLKPTSGQAVIGGWDTRQRTVAQLARRVGFAFQNPDDQLFANRVWDEVAFGPRNLGASADEVQSRVSGALAQVGLDELLEEHPYDLQLTQRKLVALASVLAMATPIVILDEPTAGQDAAGVERIGRIVAGLRRQGKTVLTITHDMDFCAEHFRRVVVMDEGLIIADGAAADVLGQAALLARADVAPPQLVRLAASLALPGTPLTLEAFLEALAARGQPNVARKEDDRRPG